MNGKNKKQKQMQNTKWKNIHLIRAKRPSLECSLQQQQIQQVPLKVATTEPEHSTAVAVAWTALGKCIFNKKQQFAACLPTTWVWAAVATASTAGRADYWCGNGNTKRLHCACCQFQPWSTRRGCRVTCRLVACWWCGGCWIGCLSCWSWSSLG